jgi:cell division protein FtsB
MKIENFNLSKFRIEKKQKIRIFTFNNLLFLFLLYFSYFGINGANGFLNLVKFNDELIELKNELKILEKKKKYLKIKNTGLQTKTLDHDLLEEESKRILGYVDANEIAILINNE